MKEEEKGRWESRDEREKERR